MSNNTAEEIAKRFYYRYSKKDCEHDSQALSSTVYSKRLEAAIQTHTTQTLNNLKDDIDGLELDEGEWGTNEDYVHGNNDCIKEALKLIEEYE